MAKSLKHRKASSYQKKASAKNRPLLYNTLAAAVANENLVAEENNGMKAKTAMKKILAWLYKSNKLSGCL